MKGFKGKYFSLKAIQATTVHIKQSAHYISVCSHMQKVLYDTSSTNEALLEEDESPPPFAVTQELDSPKRGCHCNQIFLLKVKRLFVLLIRFILKVFEYSKIFTGISPPKVVFISKQ